LQTVHFFIAATAWVLALWKKWHNYCNCKPAICY